MKINEVTKKIEPSKPRNFVAKNMTTSGAGQHKDKKKAEKQGDVKHKNKQYDISEEGEPMKVAAVSGNDVTIDQGGTQIKTTVDALAPGQTPGSFTMKPTDPNAIKPGAAVTQDATTSEESEEDVFPVAPDADGIHHETDPDLIGSGHNVDVGGDPTDRYIDQVRDKEFERHARDRSGLAGRSKRLSEDDALTKMLTIAGLR